MKAILVNDDKSLRWDDVENPVIKDDEVLVEIHAAALNRADLMQREGDYPPPPGCPEWMGLEIAGTIAGIADGAKKKSNWKIGDKVCALLGGGGYAEYVSVKYDMLMPVPENCTMVEAAAIPEAFATAYLNLFMEGNIKPGNTMPLKNMPIGTIVHNIELKPGAGGQLARSAGCYAQLMGKDGVYAQIKMNSGELRKVHSECLATVGSVSNPDQRNVNLGKAGRARWLGIRPSVRGMAMNPVDHPMGGGNGHSKGHEPVSRTGIPAKGYRTRSNKRTAKMIIRSRHLAKKK